MNEAIIGIIIGATVSLITLVVTSKIDKNIAFSDVITKERINTINMIRNLVADICVLINKKVDVNENERNRDNKNIEELLKCVIKLKMLLSIHCEREGNHYHFELEQILNNIIDGIIDKNSCKVPENKKDITNKIIKISRYIFDYEWCRIKKEADGINV